MPRSQSLPQVEGSQQKDKRSRGPSAPGAKPKPALDATKSGLRAETIALAHESILRSERCNHRATIELAYAIQINNLGCTPGVPAAVIDPWLEPAQRPAALRDRPRHELTGADPRDCRERLLAVLEAELDRLRAWQSAMRQEVDLPRLCEALDRASILTEESARRAARSGAEARAMFHRASRELVKTLIQDREDGVGPLSSVPGPLSAGNDAGAGVPEKAAAVEEAANPVTAVAARSEGEGAGPAGAGRPLPTGPDPEPLPARGQEDVLFPSEPENVIGRLPPIQDEAITSVDARVPDSGCAKRAKPGANPARARANGSKNAHRRRDGPGTRRKTLAEW